jgi:hypothetical protein
LRRGPRPPERHYIGRRPDATEVYVLGKGAPQLLAHPTYQGTAAFDWGGATPGALELAFAVLAHATERRPTDLVCQAFSADVVARLDHAGFVLTDGDVAIWLMTSFADAEPPAAGPRSEPEASRAARALASLRSLARRR